MWPVELETGSSTLKELVVAPDSTDRVPVRVRARHGHRRCIGILPHRLSGHSGRMVTPSYEPELASTQFFHILAIHANYRASHQPLQDLGPT